MRSQRGFMRVQLQERVATPVDGMRAPIEEDVAGLAALMLDAYLGTVDYEGESIEEALSEVRETVEGTKGPFLWTASRVIEREGLLASACLVIRWREQPLVAFSMTRGRFKKKGLARACLLSSMKALREQGDTTLALFVTLSNEQAVSLYRSLGFAFDSDD